MAVSAGAMHRAAKLVALGAFSVLGAAINSADDHAPHRSLQTSSNIAFVRSNAGEAVPVAQEDGQGLQVAEGAAPPSATSLTVQTDTNNTAEYEFYFAAPDTTGATGYTLTFTGQLNGAEWNVDIYDFLGLDDWVNVGTLVDITSAAWATKSLDFTGTPANFLSTSNEVLARVSASGTQVGYLDFASVTSIGGPPPTPTPPTPGGSAVYVEMVLGEPILTTQASAVPVEAAEGADVTSTDQSIKFESIGGLAQYDIFFTTLGSITGDITISIAAQLGPGAVATNWKVDIYDFRSTIGWVAAGDLTGVQSGSWGTINIVVPTTSPINFYETTNGEMLVRLYTDGATGVEVMYLDQIVVSADSAPAPSPAPVTNPPVTPTGSTSGIPVFIERVAGAPILAGQDTGVVLVTAEGADDPATSVEFTSLSNGTAEYEVYLTPPSPLAGDITISVTAKLGTGATATNWKIDLFDFRGANTWATVGDLTGVTSSFGTVNVVLPTTTPINFSETTNGELLVRLYTSGATGVETIVVDAISISAGSTPPSPTPGPMTPAPTTPAPTPGLDVEIDLVPCILAQSSLDIPQATVPGEIASAYLFNQFFKGFWTATQIVQTPQDAALDLLVDENHGKCSVIFVGIIPTAAQDVQLQDYSRKFKVRIVYFEAAQTWADAGASARLGITSDFDEPSVGAPKVKLTGSTTDSVVPTDMVTSLELFSQPIVELPAVAGAEPTGLVIMAQYADESGAVIPGNSGDNVAIATRLGADGFEEMHVFIGLAWFDLGSWAWAHYIAEWGTKGIFQGERRFYLGAVVDDLYLTTGQWTYDPPNFEGPLARVSGAELNDFYAAEQAYNTQYNAQVKTEHAFNGIGILDKIDSPWRVVEGTDSDIALLPKGQPPNPSTGIAQQLQPNWLSRAFNPTPPETGMADDLADFDADDLLVAVQDGLDRFYWQSHTLTHLSRDNLGTNDCDIEDGGNVQMAVLTGMFDSDNYNWRSMTSPGITGLFNPNCLTSGKNNLMKCYPGDNTFDGNQAVSPGVSLVNSDNQFHSVTTTTSGSFPHGVADLQIVPRFATNVYFNCVTGQCLIDENEKIRRDVCGCAELNPASPQGTCGVSCPTDDTFGTYPCPSGCSSGDTQSFNNQAAVNNADADTENNGEALEQLFQTEERTTTRYILSGRRDKYMFHQANVVPTSWDSTGPYSVNSPPSGNPSLLQYWYERVLAQMAKFINTATFPISTLKFDNLCANFYEHEDLDSSGAYLTATKDPTGAITDMALTTSSDNGAPIPLTVPTSQALSISTGTLEAVKTETYGADTTYTFAAGTLTTRPLSKPDLSELPVIPPFDSAAQLNAEEDAAIAIGNENPAAETVAEEADAGNQEVANREGFVVESVQNGNGVSPTPSPATSR